MMKYRKSNNQILIRIDKGEEILQTVLEICEIEQVFGAVFSGIGACGKATVSSFIPEKKDFINHTAEGMLELISLNGNISKENDKAFEHTHAMFSYLDGDVQKILAGHLKSAVVSYTAEILLTVTEAIEKKFDPDIGITVWDI